MKNKEIYIYNKKYFQKNKMRIDKKRMIMSVNIIIKTEKS